MSINAKILAPAFAALVVGVATVQAQDAFVQGPETTETVKITSCVVASVRDKTIHHDCTSEAAKVCDRTSRCELPIGLNLTEGRDIDPVGAPMVRRLSKVVIVEFKCGKSAEKRGPNPQDDNATLILAC